MSEDDSKEKNRLAAERAERIRQKIMSPEAWESFLFKTPCVRSSYLWGIGIGSLAFAHKLRLYPGRFRHAFDAGLFTFLFTSTASFLICSTEVNRRYSALQKAFQAQNIKPSPPSAAASKGSRE